MSPIALATSSHSLRKTAAAVVVAWFIAALCASALGLFDSVSRPPALLGAAAVLPPVLFWLARRRWRSFDAFVAAASPALLTLFQTWRIGGIVFVALYHRDLLPGAFALPAGWGDVAVGATAPLAAWLARKRTRAARAIFVAWHIVGMADLAMAVSLGVLSSDTPLGVLADGVTTRLMGQFPLSVIPTFFVPLLAILHLAALRAAQRDDARQSSAMPMQARR